MQTLDSNVVMIQVELEEVMETLRSIARKDATPLFVSSYLSMCLVSNIAITELTPQQFEAQLRLQLNMMWENRINSYQQLMAQRERYAEIFNANIGN